MGSASPKWSLTQVAFDRLLAALDANRDTAADRYLEIRRNLVRLFEWRGCTTPEDYADEAINRCARKIQEGEDIRDVGGYSIGVARMIVREMGRDRGRQAVPLADAPEPRVLPPEPESDQQERVDCLRRCLSQITPENRDLILSYYNGDKGEKIKNRKGLTAFFGVPAGAIRMRALRLRERLQTCVEHCIQRQGERSA